MLFLAQVLVEAGQRLVRGAHVLVAAPDVVDVHRVDVLGEELGVDVDRLLVFPRRKECARGLFARVVLGCLGSGPEQEQDGDSSCDAPHRRSSMNPKAAMVALGCAQGTRDGPRPSTVQGCPYDT